MTDSHPLVEDNNKSSGKHLMDVFVTRPVLAIVLSMIFVLVGLKSAFDLPILQFPKIESASLVISTRYLGASAEVVQGFITEPIERVAATVPGVDYVDAVTVAGSSTVTVWLELNEDSSAALAELSSRLDQIAFELPAAAENPNVLVKRADRPSAAFYLDVNFNGGKQGMSRAEVTDYISRDVAPALSAIPGVQRIGYEGGRSPAMRVWLDPVKMAAFNVSALDVSSALRRNNIISTMGRSENSQQRINLLSNTSLSSIEDFEQLVVREVSGSQIVLRDIARLELGEDEGNLNTRLDDNLSVFISMWPLPGANEIEIGNKLYKVLEDVNKRLPEGLVIGVGFDGTLYMRSALKEIFITLAETVFLVGLVVLFMMGSFRTALVPLVTIPISLLGAVAAMSLMGFTLNLLTVLAIVLSVGLVVDDAIVVVENVARYMRQGMSRKQAALASSRQLLAPIISMTITLAAVYAPIGLLSGLTGALFSEFAFTLAVAVLISGIVALTLSPIMSAYASPEGGQEGRFTQRINSVFFRLQKIYAGILVYILAWRPQVIFVTVFLSLLVVPFYLFSQKELAPIEDENGINVVIASAPEASLDYTTENMSSVVSALKNLEGAQYMWQVIRPSGAFGGIELSRQNERSQTVHDLFPQSFGLLSGITGLQAFPILPPPLPTAGNFEVELVILSADSPENMKPYADRLVGAAFASQKFLFAQTDLKIDLPQVRFNFDKARVADLGMSLEEVSAQLGVLLSGNFVNQYNSDGKAYRVIPMIEDFGRPNPNAILDLLIRSPEGELVPLRSIAKLETETAPRMLGKFQQKNAFRVYGGLIPGTTKEQGLAVLEKAARDILPPGYSLDYAGESRQLRQDGNSLEGVLAMALIFVFLVLAVQFNSFRDPLVVLLGSVPLALTGAMLFTFLDMTTINIYSQVGFITLVGLIAKNGILIVEFANQLQYQGYDKVRAITEAAQSRLRPVLMTTAATVLGHFPLILVSGAGAEARNSIGIILVAGMAVGTLFTLLVLPNIYVVLASTKTKKALDHDAADLIPQTGLKGA